MPADVLALCPAALLAAVISASVTLLVRGVEWFLVQSKTAPYGRCKHCGAPFNRPTAFHAHHVPGNIYDGWDFAPWWSSPMAWLRRQWGLKDDFPT